MRTWAMMCWTLFWLAVAGVVAYFLGLGDVVRASLTAGHWLDWTMGIFCLIWLIVILKVPWDLYFQAQEVTFEIERSREHNVAIATGRAEYVRRLRRRLGWLAVGAHLFSAALIAAIAHFSGGRVGYYFAAFYLISTAFRPTVAGYVYLSRKLRAIGQEIRYPRDDVSNALEQLRRQDALLHVLTDQVRECRERLQAESQKRDTETRELRQNLQAVGREFEATLGRLSDNQEVIKGIQAFVRLVTQSAQS